MVDEFKGLRDQVLKSLISSVTSRIDGRSSSKEHAESGLDASAAKDLIASVAAWAGKGKDEIVQVLCREIGVAIAAVVKEPLEQVLENRRLVISFELSPKDESKDAKKDKQSKKSRPSKKKKTTTS